MYCTKCGAKNDDSAKFCGSCGFQMGSSSERKCPDCGTPIKALETFCSKCGKKYDSEKKGSSDRATVQKSKTTAIMLALFFSFFSYLYTYRVNYLKFLISLFLFVTSIIFMAINDYAAGTDLIAGITGCVLFIFSLIDNAVRSSTFYSEFPAPPTEGKSKATAVTLTFLFGPFGLIYTWKRDWGKFTIIVAATLALHGFLGYSGEDSPFLNFFPWLVAVIFSIARSREFYEDYDYSE
jgi:predicted nucleic acid-binding Zn ribbon protein